MVFFVNCLNGLPEVYVKFFVKQIGVKNFYKLIKNEKDRNVYIVYSLVYCEHNKKSKVFSVKFFGKLSKLKEGNKWLTDGFIPEGKNLTVGELKSLGKEEDYEFF